MPTEKSTNTDGHREPVSEKFGKFERNYGGDPVNAHDDRMDKLLHDNAEQLDQELDRKDSADR